VIILAGFIFMHNTYCFLKISYKCTLHCKFYKY